MRYLFGFLCVCVLGAVPLVGCSESTGDAGSGGSAGTGGSGGDGGASGIAGNGGAGGAPEFRTYVMEFFEFDPEGIEVRLEGVEVCEADTDNCVTSNAGGFAMLDVPDSEEVTITMEKEGYGRWVTGDVSDETAGPEGGTATIGAWWMYTHAQLAAIAEQLPTPYPWEGGIVALVRWPSPHAGATFTPVGSTVDAVGEAFYFDAETEKYSLDLEATTEFPMLWEAPLAEGGFAEVTPGEQQFEFGGTAGDCRPSWGWPGDARNRIRVPVREGYRTYGSMICDEQ